MSSKANYEIVDRQEIEATIRVSIPVEAVEQEIDAVYREYAKEVRVPGFRKGHVPRSYLDTRFGPAEFRQEARDELQRKHLPLAVAELGLRPVSRPKLKSVDLADSEPFVFTATFATLPQVTLPELGALRVEVPARRAVAEEDVAQALEDVRQQFGVLGPREGDVVSDGDLVRVKEADHEWDTRAMSENPITRNLVGAKVGSTVDIETTLENGKAFKTALHVVGLRQIILPEVDDDLAKDAGYADLEALRKDIEDKLNARRVDLHRQRIHATLLDELVSHMTINLPDVFLDELTEEELTRLQESFKRPEADRTYAEYLEQRGRSEEELKAEIRSSIQNRVRRELVLQQLAVDLHVALSDDELRTLAEQDAAEYGEDPVRFVARLKAEDRWDDYRASRINERCLEALAGTATVIEKEES